MTKASSTALLFSDSFVTQILVTQCKGKSPGFKGTEDCAKPSVDIYQLCDNGGKMAIVRNVDKVGEVPIYNALPIVGVE